MSNTDHIICIRQIVEKKWEYSEVDHQIFIDFKENKEYLHYIVIEPRIPLKPVRIIKSLPE